MFLKMETKIWVNNTWRNVKPTDSVNTTRAMHSFCTFNNLPDALFKTQGGWYLLKKDKTLEFVTRTLNSITFQQLYNIHKPKTNNMSENESSPLDEMKGAFVSSLVRNNKKIREDRAIAIAEQAEMLYKREVEDLNMQIKTLKREREGMLDLSPTDAQSLVMASDFDAKDFVQRDIDLGIKIRNLEIKIEIAEARYNTLFKA